MDADCILQCALQERSTALSVVLLFTGRSRSAKQKRESWCLLRRQACPRGENRPALSNGDTGSELGHRSGDTQRFAVRPADRRRRCAADPPWWLPENQSPLFRRKKRAEHRGTERSARQGKGRDWGAGRSAGVLPARRHNRTTRQKSLTRGHHRARTDSGKCHCFPALTDRERRRLPPR